MKYIQHSLLGLLLFIITLPAQAIITGELIMIRSDKAFAEAMVVLQDAIKKQGYILSDIQQVDTGLAQSGYKSDDYRVIFFGKTEEIKALRKSHPDLVPYLPLKIAIYAEARETLLVASDPAIFIDLYPDPRLQKIFQQWHDDLISIMKNVQK